MDKLYWKGNQLQTLKYLILKLASSALLNFAAHSTSNWLSNFQNNFIFAGKSLILSFQFQNEEKTCPKHPRFY